MKDKESYKPEEDWWSETLIGNFPDYFSITRERREETGQYEKEKEVNQSSGGVFVEWQYCKN